ncbi:hypothetical protein J2X68_005404 [Streptomyces sp. 3330]|uniref:hypothetical protein n=1 Tax=Streptomyces sp. 3330 TaxID=2817755 RepID=UPI002861AE6C|nr:hypothetical protein [Streptomyces sp. 3330]MDR6978678.1 hypothetical protein [Streptomyces sp. 3330]
MRSLLAAILSLFLPPRGAHRALDPLPPAFPLPSPAASARRPVDVVLADGLPLVRPYLAVWERERDARDRRHLPRERHRTAVLAALGQDRLPAEAAA